MITLKVNNVFTEVIGAPKDLEIIIWEKLSFQIQEFGAQQVRYRHLFNRKTKRTYTGLLSYITDEIEKYGTEYEIIDERYKWEPNANFKLVDFIDKDKKIPLKARPYQQEIIDNAEPRACIQAATGAGKTFMMAGLMAKFNVKPIAIFADKLSLCTQLKDEFEKFLGVPVGLVGGGINTKEDITVYSIQSVTENDVKDAKMIMFDECLDGNTLLTMSDGSKKTIKDIVENKLTDKIVSYNTKLNCFEDKEIYNWQKIPLKNKNKKMIKLTIEDELGNLHSIECTEDHKIWVESEKKYIKAGKLIKNMEVVCE